MPRQVSATFAASLVTSPAIGAYLSAKYGDSLVVLVATVIAVADIAFVFFVVPESLPDKMRLTSWGFPISWEQADPFAVSSRVQTPALHHTAGQRGGGGGGRRAQASDLYFFHNTQFFCILPNQVHTGLRSGVIKDSD